MSTGDSIPLSGRSCHNLDRVREREKEKKCLVVELCLIKLIIYYFKVACYCTLLSQAEKNKFVYGSLGKDRNIPSVSPAD